MNMRGVTTISPPRRSIAALSSVKAQGVGKGWKAHTTAAYLGLLV